MGTLVVGAALASVLGLAVRSMVRDKKKGISLSCGKSCSHCCGCQGGCGGCSSCSSSKSVKRVL